jgi:hypothetical protein
VRAYCQQAGVEESAFYWWRRQLSRRNRRNNDVPPDHSMPQSVATKSASRISSSVADRVGFLPVQVTAGHRRASGGRDGERGPAIEILLEGGRVLRILPGFDRQTLADVLAVLEVRSC